MNEDLHTYNPYVYCGNNPVGRIDATGLSWDDITNWFNDRWNEVSTWASNTFSGAVYASNSYEGLQLTALYGGIESGISTLRIIAGDNEKSVVFFVQNASEWWKIWEYKAGITLNIGDGGCSVGFGLGEGSASACVGGSSIEVMGGVNKIGITFSQDVDFKKRTAGVYNHIFIRQWTIAITAAAAVSLGAVGVGAMAGAGVAAAALAGMG